MKYASKQRRDWLKWHFDKGGNVSATCRQFGISRGTFYRWLRRYDVENPSKVLRSPSTRRISKRKPKWTDLDLGIIAELNMRYPRLGAGKLAEKTQNYGLPFSRSTVGRMLRKVIRKCPTCRNSEGRHDAPIHILALDLLDWGERIRQRKQEWVQLINSLK